MSPDTLETRFAELRAEVRAWEHQLRTQGPLITQFEVLRSELERAKRDIESLRAEVNQRLHDLHDETNEEMRRGFTDLHVRIDRIVEKRDLEMRELAKRREDGDLALEEKIEIRARECRTFTETEISEVVQAHTLALGDLTTKRGQNLLLLASLISAILLLANGLLTAFG